MSLFATGLGSRPNCSVDDFTICKLPIAKESNFDKLAACSDGLIRMFPSCPLLPTILGSRSRRFSVLRVAEPCELTLLLAILATCKLSSDEPGFAEFAACSDAL